MHKLKAITPLGAAAPGVDTFSGVTITEVTDRALASVSMRAGRDAEFSRRAKDVLGFDLPQPGHAVTGATYSAFWESGRTVG